MTGAIVVSGASSLPVAHVAPAVTPAGTTRGGPGSLILLLGLAVAAIAGYTIGQWRRRPASA
jgi:hypothetical protein